MPEGSCCGSCLRGGNLDFGSWLAGYILDESLERML